MAFRCYGCDELIFETKIYDMKDFKFTDEDINQVLIYKDKTYLCCGFAPNRNEVFLIEYEYGQTFGYQFGANADEVSRLGYE